MPVAKRKGAAGLCDDLAARIVRSRGACEYPGCGSPNVVWAHILGRGQMGVRCETDNAWAMCPTHHHLVDNYAHEKMDLVRATIGEDRYYELLAQSHAYKTLPDKGSQYWVTLAPVLQARCRELGLSDKRTP